MPHFVPGTHFVSQPMALPENDGSVRFNAPMGLRVVRRAGVRFWRSGCRVGVVMRSGLGLWEWEMVLGVLIIAQDLCGSLLDRKW
jgi:hypothetical protein